MTMADPPTDATAAESAQPLTNFDRLAAHLKPDGLAHALLAAWRHGDPVGAQARLRDAVDNHFAKKVPSDGKPSNPEN
jgi:hypothetical protein